MLLKWLQCVQNNQAKKWPILNTMLIFSVLKTDPGICLSKRSMFMGRNVHILCLIMSRERVGAVSPPILWKFWEFYDNLGFIHCCIPSVQTLWTIPCLKTWRTVNGRVNLTWRLYRKHEGRYVLQTWQYQTAIMKHGEIWDVRTWMASRNHLITLTCKQTLQRFCKMSTIAYWLENFV